MILLIFDRKFFSYQLDRNWNSAEIDASFSLGKVIKIIILY